MIAILMSPLMPWLVLAALLAVGVALVTRRLAPLAGLALLALLLGAGRGVLAPTVELPASLAGQTVAVSGTVDDDPVERKGTRRLTVQLTTCSGAWTRRPVACASWRRPTDRRPRITAIWLCSVGRS